MKTQNTFVENAVINLEDRIVSMIKENIEKYKAYPTIQSVWVAKLNELQAKKNVIKGKTNKVIKVKKISNESYFKLLALGYTVIFV